MRTSDFEPFKQDEEKGNPEETPKLIAVQSGDTVDDEFVDNRTENYINPMDTDEEDEGPPPIRPDHVV